jgi:hypothetical protein
MCEYGNIESDDQQQLDIIIVGNSLRFVYLEWRDIYCEWKLFIYIIECSRMREHSDIEFND